MGEARIRVRLGRRSYELIIGLNLLANGGRFLREAGLKGKVLLVTNDTVGDLYLDPLLQSMEETGFKVGTVLIPDGEEYKNLSQVERVYEAAVRMRLERASTIVALGGGVIGDLAGFAAATYLRGVKFVQVPTTLLAQVDSSIGGKVAVNHRDGKNLIGSFYQPQVVLSDLATLKTLKERDFLAGLAEVIKAGLIKDQRLCTILAKSDGEKIRNDPRGLTEIICRASSIKADIVKRDEWEKGLREVLNYGHTIGHALEAETNYQRYRHGEAVAIGIHGAAKLGVLMGIFSPEGFKKTLDLLNRYNLPIETSGVSGERILERMFLDKKVSGDRLRLILPVQIGKVVAVEDPPLELLREVVHSLGAD